MNAFELYRYTVVAPHVTNAGEPSGYPQALRFELRRAGYDGWTEYETVGSWRGKREPGTLFELYWGRPNAAEQLATLARRAMPDQEAIQITRDAHPTLLWEA